MTLDQLVDLDPAELDAMSEAQLTEYLAPYIPIVRAAYSGKKESTIVLAPGTTTSRKAVDKKMQFLMNYLASANPQTKA